MTPRGRYHYHSTEVKKRVLDAFDNGEDWRQIARLIGVKSSTAASWVIKHRSNQETRRHGGHRISILNESEIEDILDWIAVDSTITLEWMCMRVKAEFGKEVSKSTLGRYLDCRLITMKKLHLVSETMNTWENKRKRKHFVFKLLQYEAEGKTIIWIDETNFNLYCNQTRGRSPRGTRAKLMVASSPGPNLHIIGAMTPDRLISFTLKRGTFRMDSCNEWLRGVLSNINEPMSNVVVVCDNAPCHSRLERISEEPPYQGCIILRLAPYSPALNPIEGVWSILKSKLKAIMKETRSEILMAVGDCTISKKEKRLRYLENAALKARDGFESEHCRRLVQHVSRMYSKVLRLEDL